MIGYGHLVTGLRMPLERSRSVDSIDNRDYACECHVLCDHIIDHQGLQDGQGIGEPARFNDDTLKHRHGAYISTHQQIMQRGSKIILDLAA